jgi:transcription initiation factor TFIIB
MEASSLEAAADEDVCPECGSSHLVRDYVRGELVCEGCGLVVRENYIDKGPEWTGIGDESASRARTGAPSNVGIHDKGLTTEISPAPKDSQGRPLAMGDRGRLYRMRMLQKRMKYSRTGERSLAEALMELDRMSSIMGIPRQFKDEAALVYRRAASRGLVRGRTIQGMVAASIYIACRVMMAPRTLDEVSELLGVPKKELTLSYKAIVRGLELGIPPPRAEDFLRRFASRLDLPRQVEAKALELVRRAEKAERFHSKAPAGTVAACIYLASMLTGQKISQDRISEVAGVSEVTIRVRYTTIASALGLQVSPRRSRDHG